MVQGNSLLQRFIHSIPVSATLSLHMLEKDPIVAFASNYGWFAEDNPYEYS